MEAEIAMENEPTESLARRWEELAAAEPRLRQRDAAQRLGSSEGQLVASQLSSGRAVRLQSRWLDLLRDFEALGQVMALTRNPHCVIEKTGIYGNVSSESGGHVGQVLGADEEQPSGVDLRLFLRGWSAGFACFGPDGTRRSFQFFSPGGQAIHKVHLLGRRSQAAFDLLVDTYALAHQTDPFDASVVDPTPPTAKPDDQMDTETLLAGWEALQDTHDFFHLLRRTGATRTQALRLGSPRWAERVRLGSWRRALRVARDARLPLMAFVGNAGVLQIHTGPVRNLVGVDEWFNVMDPGFNLHLHEPGVAEAWVVRKPARGAIVESLELYDAQGRTVALLFVKRSGDGEPAPAAWRQVLSALPRA